MNKNKSATETKGILQHKSYKANKKMQREG